jgi:hypothetical protein
MMADGTWQRMGDHDAEHMRDFPPDASYGEDQGARQGKRASEIRAALKPLSEVTPHLTRQYLVKGWIDRGTCSVVYGESNVGKTFLALDMALHVAAGWDWHGAKIRDVGPVVYIASEGGRGVCNRIAAVKREYPELAQAAAGNFMLLSAALDMCKADGLALIEALRGLPQTPRLIIIDTLARSMGGGDENSGADMGAFIRATDQLRAATGAHVMIIHHAGKDAAKGARGHSSLRAAVDTEIQITRDGAVILAETRKQRDMEGDRSFGYTLRSVHLGDDEDGDPVTSCVVTPCDAPAKRGPVITGQAKVALQAFGDALAHHGEVKLGDMFPANRQCVPLERWREYCDRLSLSSGETATAKRTAFFKSKATLQEKGFICVVDNYAWRVAE